MSVCNTSSVLRAASLILDYPAYDDTISLINEVRNLISPDVMEIESFLKRIEGMNIVDLQENYVATFDMSSRNTLYLTAWELGDSRGRGSSLIDLKRTIESFHFTIVGRELPDYIPLILEFLSEIPRDDWPPTLETRLEAYFSTMSKKIDSGLYGRIFSILASIFKKRTNINAPEPVIADTGVMPYPIRYSGGDY